MLRREPVQKSGSAPVELLAMRAGRSGQFVFPSVAPGAYLLHAMRAGPLQMLTDTAGRFHFDSLPAGDYRILASFDLNEIDAEMMEASRASVVHADASQTATVDLALWIAP